MSQIERPYDMPFTRVELILMALKDAQLQVLIAKRAEEPHKGKWAIPGGVLRIDLDRSLEDAVQRVAIERLGTHVPNPQQVGTVGGPDRDSKRATWALSVVYRSTVNPADLNLAAGKRIERLQWTDLAQLKVERNFAFDHQELILHAAEQLRQEVSELNFPHGLMPDEFTLGELQAFAEQVLGRRLDKSSFRRRIAERDLLRTVEGSMRTGANRPAQLFQFK